MREVYRKTIILNTIEVLIPNTKEKKVLTKKKSKKYSYKSWLSRQKISWKYSKKSIKLNKNEQLLHSKQQKIKQGEYQAY